jgi:adenylate kinase
MPGGRTFAKNLTILGAPGSGKGFYGGPLASCLGVPLWTASSILRRRSGSDPADLASGRLVECRVASEAVRQFLAEKGKGGFVLDGFPRTREQIDLMAKSWPEHHQVQFCVWLDIPDEICIQKAAGRRRCRVCNRYVNLASVRTLGFDLPPQVPRRDANGCTCRPEADWLAREDDAPEIVRRRLRMYREHEDPIVDYYRRRGRLLALTPYHGEKDIPNLQRTVLHWLRSCNGGI